MVVISSFTGYAANGLNVWGIPLQLGLYKVDGDVYIGGSAYIYDSECQSFYDFETGQTFYSDALDGTYDVYLHSYDQYSMTLI